MDTTFITPEKQLEILERGIVDLQVKDELLAKLRKSHASNKPLIIKAGFDPTAPDLHLGHAVLLTKMRQFQDLGHTVIFLIGDFTGLIGDPTGKNITRPPLSEAEIQANAVTYERQVYKILSREKTQVSFNSKWLSPMGFADLIRLAAKYSLARMIERDDFKKRLNQGTPISMHELLYPLAQGYDSVVLKADVELGGADQLFNLLVGRDLMRAHGLEPQCIMTVPLLLGLDGREEAGELVGNKMSKSLGNYVGIEEDANAQFGKIMSVCDPLMWRYYEVLSLRSAAEIAELKAGHPKEAKEKLALELVERFHNKELALAAQSHFQSLFGAKNKHEIPEDAPHILIELNDSNEITLTEALVKAKFVDSNGEAKRLIKQGGVSVNGETVVDIFHKLAKGNFAIRAGKKRWAKIEVC